MEFKLTLPSEPKSRTGLMTSLNNALKLLKQFTLVTPVLGVSELAARLDLNKATVFNMLKTFEAHGLVVQEPKSKKYMLGPAIIELAGTKLAQDDLPQVSRRYLAQLSSETRETAHLATLYESEVLYLGGFKSEVQHLPPSKVSRCKAVHPEGINSSRQRTA